MSTPPPTSSPRKSLAIDTNVLILLVVGLNFPTYVGKSTRLDRYDIADFRLLRDFVELAPRALLTQNVLTETSNLLAQAFKEPRKADLLGALAGMVINSGESVADSRVVMLRPEFPRLGLTDAALIEVCRKDAVLLTDDEKLHSAALAAGCEAVHFEELRSLA